MADAPALTLAQKDALRAQGFLVLRGVVPQARVEAALRAIHASIGRGLPPGELRAFESRSFCPELREAPVIHDLLEASPLRALVESAVGRGKVLVGSEAQIALRFPVVRDDPPPPSPHVDGFHAPDNGVPAGRIAAFTGLAGVFLTDVPRPFAANLTVWPGTHEAFARYYRTHAPDPALPDGVPPVALPAPVQLEVRAGDAVLAHYQLAHAASANVSPWIRAAVYFRFHHVDHCPRAPELLADLWRDWDGVG